MLNAIRNWISGLFAQKEPLELSYSKISAYRFCPWKYKLIYVDGLKVPPNPYISLGLSIHRTLEEYHKSKQEDLDHLMEVYNEVWVNEGFANPQQTMHFYERGKKMLEQYFQFSQDRKTEIFAVEKDFSFPVGKRVMRGIIDRIDKLPDGTYEVIDYKTHAEMWEQSRIDADLQLTIYSLGCKKSLNIAPSAFSYFFLAHNKVITTQRTKIQESAALAEFEAVAKEIENKNFTANTSSCPRCDFRTSCRFAVKTKAPQTTNA